MDFTQFVSMLDEKGLLFTRADLLEDKFEGTMSRPLYDFLSADTNPVPAKWLAHRIGWMNATLRLPLVIPPELSRRLSGNDALVACAALLGY